jgi:hypothetical protein
MAIDHCEPQVKTALEKEGWIIPPYQVRLIHGERTIYIDLEANRQLNGSKRQILLLEVKCFPEAGTNSELFLAFGQYIFYRSMLRAAGISTALYLSVPLDVYSSAFDAATMRVVSDNQVKIVVVDLVLEEIAEWIE